LIDILMARYNCPFRRWNTCSYSDSGVRRFLVATTAV